VTFSAVRILRDSGILWFY